MRVRGVVLLAIVSLLPPRPAVTQLPSAAPRAGGFAMVATAAADAQRFYQAVAVRSAESRAFA
jgi:hypothetical protein